VLEAMEEAEAEGKGVFSLDGKMVDAPIIQRARQMVALAEKLGMIGVKQNVELGVRHPVPDDEAQEGGLV
jgi:hypothetical protein